MAAYLIVQSTINDEAQYQKYRVAVEPLITRHGGEFVVKGGKVERLEGHHDGQRMVIIRFPSMDAIRAYRTSEEYDSVKKIRDGAATLDVWAVPGV